MGGVGVVAQRIEEQDIEAAQIVERCRRNLAVIGKVGRAAEAKSINRRSAVQQRNWLELHSKNIEGLAVERVRVELRHGGFALLIGENVTEDAMDSCHRVGRCENRNARFLAEIEGANIVEAHDVVGVRVGEKDGIEAVNFGAQHLGAKVG